jgi:uncharacterized protein
MERKLYELKGTVSGEAPGTIEGHGAVTGNMDRGGDIIEPGAFKNLDSFVKDGCLLVGHERGSMGVGTIDMAREDGTGLFFKATFHSDDSAQMCRQRVMDRMTRNKSVGLSIGYSAKDYTDGRENDRYVRRIKALEVYEISIVTVPMNPEATVTGAKSFDGRCEEAFAALKSVAGELGNIRELRLKDGRNWPSEFNRSRIEAFAAETDELHKQLTELLSEPPAMATPEQVAETRRKMASLRLQLAGAR